MLSPFIMNISLYTLVCCITVYFRANYFVILNFALPLGRCLLSEEFAPGKQIPPSGVDPSLEGINCPGWLMGSHRSCSLVE